MDRSIVNTVNTIYEVGKEQYAKYYKDVLNDCICSIHCPIKKNSLPHFRYSHPKTKGKHSEKIYMLRNDISLFSCLYNYCDAAQRE